MVFKWFFVSGVVQVLAWDRSASDEGLTHPQYRFSHQISGVSRVRICCVTRSFNGTILCELASKCEVLCYNGRFMIVKVCMGSRLI